MPRVPLGRPDAPGKDGAAATPVPTPLRASRPLPELNGTAASSWKSGAQPGVSPLPPPKAPASRHPSGFPGSLRPSAPATPPCGAPRNPQGAARGSGRLPAGRAHRPLPPLSRTSAPQRHFRPSAAWPRAGVAHAQRPMELPESGQGLLCRGEPAAEAALARLSTQACESGDTKTSKEGPVPRMCPLTER